MSIKQRLSLVFSVKAFEFNLEDLFSEYCISSIDVQEIIQKHSRYWDSCIACASCQHQQNTDNPRPLVNSIPLPYCCGGDLTFCRKLHICLFKILICFLGYKLCSFPSSYSNLPITSTVFHLYPPQVQCRKFTHSHITHYLIHSTNTVLN